jgi:hypothetical protein
MMTGTLSPGAWLPASALIALLFALPVCAQTPVNPLRSVLVQEPNTEATPRFPSGEPYNFEELHYSPADEAIARRNAEVAMTSGAEPLPGASSVVPPQFGERPPVDPWQVSTPHQSPPGTIGPHDSFVQPWFTHTDPNDPFRHQGVGRPLVGTSWLNRPVYVGLFLGGLLADDLISGHVESNNSFFLGGRLGWDFDHYWGLEGRYAFSRPQINDGDGNTLSKPARDYFIDVSLAYYPWGDSQWRPFISGGLGLQTFRFHDDEDERIHQSLLSFPIGVGIKFYHSPFHTLRLEAYDNIAFGDGRMKTMQNFTLAVGVEFRFGGRPVSYFPWHGSTSYW